VPTGADEATRRSHPAPLLGPKSSIGELLHLPHNFPGGNPRRSHRIPANRRPHRSQGPNCVAKFLSKEFCVNWGHICEVPKSFRGLSEKL
jgi:hypothetical protein